MNALEFDDLAYFKEAQANMQKEMKLMKAAQEKYEVTKGKFLIEKAAKDTRDLAEKAEAEEKAFNERSGKRKTDYDAKKKTKDDAADALKKNTEDIAKWKGIL